MRRGWVAAVVILGGVGWRPAPAPAQLNCNVGVDFYPSGAIRSCTLNGHHRLHTAQGQALTCADGHVLVQYENGRLQSCVLAQPLAAGARQCPAGSRAEFGPDGTLTGCPAAAGRGEGDPGWHYTLGRERTAQHANFCRHREVVLEVAQIFQAQGPRAGYAALSQARGCETRVESFTPRAVLTQVAIPTGEGGGYTVRFVEVAIAGGRVEYLVTTRDVRP